MEGKYLNFFFFVFFFCIKNNQIGKLPAGRGGRAPSPIRYYMYIGKEGGVADVGLGGGELREEG